MFTVRKLVVCAVALLAMFARVAGQDTKSSEQFVEAKGFVGRVFEVKHRNPDEIAYAIRPLLSGFKGATLSVSREFNTITVRDWPENVALIEGAIKRLDVPKPVEPPKPPPPPKPAVEIRIDMISASRASGGSSTLTGDLTKVVDQLKATLSYGSYRLVSTFLSRGNQGSTLDASGILDGLLPAGDGKADPLHPSFYSLESRPITVSRDSSEQIFAEIPNFRFRIRVPIAVGATISGQAQQIQYQDIGISNSITLKEGEMVVVGTTSAGPASDAIIIVVSFRRVS